MSNPTRNDNPAPNSVSYHFVYHILFRGEVLEEYHSLITLTNTYGSLEEIGAMANHFLIGYKKVLKEAQSEAEMKMQSLPNYRRYSEDYKVRLYTVIRLY